MCDLEPELLSFVESEWGQVCKDRWSASGLCLRATLVLLARLERAGLAGDVSLWNLTQPRPGAERGDSGTHWVLSDPDDVMIDVTAKQFDPTGPAVRRGPLADELARWVFHEKLDPDGEDMWEGGLLKRRAIPPYWRGLLDVSPPGDLPGWPYPAHRLDERSPWFRPAGEPRAS